MVHSMECTIYGPPSIWSNLWSRQDFAIHWWNWLQTSVRALFRWIQSILNLGESVKLVSTHRSILGTIERSVFGKNLHLAAVF